MINEDMLHNEPKQATDLNAVYYTGVRTKDGARVWRCDHRTMRPLPARNDVRNHSPDGFEWGYGGSGPAQLALAICLDVLGGDVVRAVRVYQDVKWRLIGTITTASWTLRAAAVLVVILECEAEEAFARESLEAETAKGREPDGPPALLGQNHPDFKRRGYPGVPGHDRPDEQREEPA